VDDTGSGPLKKRILQLGQELHDAIDGLRETPPDWRSTLAIDLAATVLQNSKLATEGYDEADTCKCALGARNLLELSCWASYVATSEDNARRLHEDALCDGQDLIAKVAKYQGIDHSIRSSQDQLDALLPLMEQIDADDRFLKVTDIAKALGVHNTFDVANKFVSKFVHPSSLSIQVQKLPKEKASVLSVLLELSTTLIETTFPILTRYIKTFDSDKGAEGS
jgi:hypothetical protein